MKRTSLLNALVLGVAVMCATACSEDNSGGEYQGGCKVSEEVMDRVIATYVDKTVIPTYALMEEKVAALDAAVQTFIAAPTQDNLDKTCDAWRAARKPWEESEAFLYGPADYENLDPSLDTWPLQKDDIDQLLASQDFSKFEDDTEAAQGVRGFHTLEYLIFSDGAPKDVATVTENEKGYMKRVSARLLSDTKRLHKAWTDGLGTAEVNTSFGDEMKAHDGTRISSAQLAISQYIITGGIVNISDEVGGQKIANPYEYWKNGQKEQAVLEVESWFSWNSLTDYEDNIVSIENSYMGGREDDRDEATSMSAMVRSVDPALDQRVRDQIAATRKAIRDIPHPFRNNLGATAEITKAMNECTNLSNVFNEIISTLNL